MSKQPKSAVNGRKPLDLVCGNCRHWHKIEQRAGGIIDLSAAGLGQCRGGPPSAMLTPSGVGTAYPGPDADDPACAIFMPRPATDLQINFTVQDGMLEQLGPLVCQKCRKPFGVGDVAYVGLFNRTTLCGKCVD